MGRGSAIPLSFRHRVGSALYLSIFDSFLPTDGVVRRYSLVQPFNGRPWASCGRFKQFKDGSEGKCHVSGIPETWH